MPLMLQTGNLEVAYETSGEGPPLLLLHGAEGSRRMFDHLVPYLANHFTVIRYDQRDCGETQNPPTPSSLADLAEDARALLLALGIPRAHVYGTSFGGRVAQVLAGAHAQVVDRLILGSTWPLPHALQALNEVAVGEILALRGRLPESAGELAQYFFPAQFLDSHPQFRSIFQNAQPDSERGRRRSQTVNDCPAVDLRTIKAPTLLLAGQLDRVVPAHITAGMAATIAGAQTVVLEGVGHAGVAQAPDVISGHIRRFLLP